MLSLRYLQTSFNEITLCKHYKMITPHTNVHFSDKVMLVVKKNETKDNKVNILVT